MIAVPESIAQLPSMQDVASIWTRRERMCPSDWAAANRMVTHSPRPGMYDASYLPWLRLILDVWHHETNIDGICVMKPAQMGISELFVTLLGWLADYEPGPMCMACTTNDDALDFSHKRIEPMIEHSPRLSALFKRGRLERETRLRKPFAGGVLAMVGSNSPTKFISQPYRYFVLDEEDQLHDFPGLGNARSVAERRLGEYKTQVRTGIFSYAHPTRPDRGVALTFYTYSDQREWMIECPHCNEWHAPKWPYVQIDNRDPQTARYCCPACQEPLTDAQRWRATRNGRFESTLSDADRSRRRMAGFHFSALCHPRITLEELAGEYVACHSESQLQVFYNMRMGEPYVPASHVLTKEAIDAKMLGSAIERGGEIVCPSDTQFITLGCDVQQGPIEAILYIVLHGWTSAGNAWLLRYAILRGWPALDHLLKSFRARRSGTRGSTGELPIRAAGIDYGYRTREVYDFCRQNHGGVPCLPLKHTAGVKPDDPIRHKKTVDPSRPELGKMTRLELCRDHWMDRHLARFDHTADPSDGGSIVLPIGCGNDFVAHVRANHREEMIDEHGHPRSTWIKDKSSRDDWLQASVYSEVVAVLLGLDTIHTMAPTAPAERIDEIREGIVERGAKHTSRPGYAARGARSGRRMW